jgi:hypothetical protein
MFAWSFFTIFKLIERERERKYIKTILFIYGTSFQIVKSMHADTKFYRPIDRLFMRKSRIRARKGAGNRFENS